MERNNYGERGVNTMLQATMRLSVPIHVHVHYPCLVYDTPGIYRVISGYGHYTRALIMVSAGSLQCYLHRWNNNPFTHGDARSLLQIPITNALSWISPKLVIRSTDHVCHRGEAPRDQSQDE
jgi:hypothetical protein